MNGPTSNIVKNIPLSATTLQQQQQQQHQPQVSGEQLSTLKTIAQEVLNRNALEPPISQAIIGGVSSTINNIAPSQQQQQQQLQQQQSTQQPPQPDTRQGSGSTSGFTNDTTATNGPNLTSNTATNVSNTGRESAKQQQQLSTVGAATTTTTTTAITNEAHIPPLLGVAPLGPSPLQKEHQIQVRLFEFLGDLNEIIIFFLQFQLMEAAYYHMPQPSDSERLRNYLHRQPVQTPPHYPQVLY